jgi:subtilase family serine protease
MEIRLNVLPVEEAAEAPPQAQAQASGADLELMPGTLEFSAPAFRVGKDIKIAVKVKNTGTKKLTPVEVAFWADEAMIGEATVKGLAPGEKEMLVIKWTPEMSGTYTIYAIADPNKRFHEIDEGNNRDSRQITISD